MNGWKFCVTDPQDAALALCRGSMDGGDGCGYGYGTIIGWGRGDGYGYAGGIGCGFRDGNGCGGRGNGSSPEEWL
jgi:hypothetical protein